MRKPTRSFLRLFLGGGLSLFVASLAAAPAVLLETARLVPSDGAPEGGFGRAIAINGDIALVAANIEGRAFGAGPESFGAVYVFERDPSGVWRQTAKLTSGREGDLFGLNVAVDGNIIVVGAAHSFLTHVFEKQGGSWQPTAVLGAGTPGNLGRGNSVAVENGVVAIGDDDPHGMGLYRRGASGWAQIASYVNGMGIQDDDYFSPPVDISQNVAIHGSWGSEFEPVSPSTAFIYTPGTGGNWAQPSVTTVTQPGGGAAHGFSLARVMISGNTALIDDWVFTRNSTGQWVNTARVPTALALDDDETRLLGRFGPFRFATLHRRDTTGAWPVRAELATSDAAPITLVRIDIGRALLASYPNNVAYVFETPENLDRPELQQDDFQDGDANGWATTPGSLFAVASSGSARFYRQSSVAGNSTALWQSPVTNDQAIQADIIPRAFDGTDRWFGLVTRYSNINNYYYVTARSTGSIQLRRLLAGAITTLGSAALPVAIGRTHRIRLEAVGDHIRVLVNDRPVIRVRDSSFTGGVPGLITFKARADFDNVVVNANPAYVAAADDFEREAFGWNPVAGNWSRVNANGSWIRRQSDLSGGARLLMPGSFGNFYGTFGDQIVQADLRPTAFSGTDRWVGLIARYRDDANYHYVTLRNSGRLDIRRLVNGSIQTLSTVPFTVQPNVNYRVRFEAIGTRLRVYVNGTLRAEATDASLTRAVSSAGFATFKAALDVDNFSVVQP
jgi:hypothetical protein